MCGLPIIHYPYEVYNVDLLKLKLTLFLSVSKYHSCHWGRQGRDGCMGSIGPFHQGFFTHNIYSVEIYLLFIIYFKCWCSACWAELSWHENFQNYLMVLYQVVRKSFYWLFPSYWITTHSVIGLSVSMCGTWNWREQLLTSPSSYT